MDANPFSYQVMADEAARWYTDFSTNPGSLEPGQAQQYAIVDMATSGRGVSSVAVDVHLSGSSQWLGATWGGATRSSAPATSGPLSSYPWGGGRSSITGLQVAVEPPSAASTLTVRFVRIEWFTGTQVLQFPRPDRPP